MAATKVVGKTLRRVHFPFSIFHFSFVIRRFNLEVQQIVVSGFIGLPATGFRVIAATLTLNGAKK